MIGWILLDRVYFVSPSSVGVDGDMTGERTSGVTDSNFPHVPPRKTVVTVVFNYYVGRSVELNEKSYTSKERHVSTNNLIQNIEKTSKRCVSHTSVDVLLYISYNV